MVLLFSIFHFQRFHLFVQLLRSLTIGFPIFFSPSSFFSIFFYLFYIVLTGAFIVIATVICLNSYNHGMMAHICC